MYAVQPEEIRAAIRAYEELKEQNPEYLVAVQLGDHYETFGEDAEIAAPLWNRKLLSREFPSMGETGMTGFYPSSRWASYFARIWKTGKNVLFAARDTKNAYAVIKKLTKEDYIPLGTAVSIEERRFFVDRVDFNSGKVRLQSILGQNEAKHPIFIEEPISAVREQIEEQGTIIRQDQDLLAILKQKLAFTTENKQYGAFRSDIEVLLKDKNGDSIIGIASRTWLDMLVEMSAEDLRDYVKQYRKGDLNAYDIMQDSSPKREARPHPYQIQSDTFGQGTPKEKFRYNMDAIHTLKQIEAEGRIATAAEQEILARYVGWGGLSDAFDPEKWPQEQKQLRETLTEEEYVSARASTLNAHYTQPMIIRAIYDTVSRFGYKTGNILEPALGVGNFFGMLPEEMRKSRLYGAELDSISGRIAKQLYPQADIQITGYEKTKYPDNFFDLAVGNVPFGDYKVMDKKYDKHNFLIHDYFFAKTLDQLRPGGIAALVTSKGTMDKANPKVRKYLAERVELLGAVRLPNTAFKQNAGTTVTSDILFLQKRERPMEQEPDWVNLGTNASGLTMNQYFIEHPEMLVGEMREISGPFGSETACVLEDTDQFPRLLSEALANISGHMEFEMIDNLEGLEIEQTLPADLDVPNYGYTVKGGQVYFRENSQMYPCELAETTSKRVAGMVEIRDLLREVINLQLEEEADEPLHAAQKELERVYDRYTKAYGLLNSLGNRRAFQADNTYPLLAALEELDAEGNLLRKADLFYKRTITKAQPVQHTDTAAEALVVSLAEKGRVDVGFMSDLSGKRPEDVEKELQGVIFRVTGRGDGEEAIYVTADEYLSGNVREKLKEAESAAQEDSRYLVNVQALEKAQPKPLSASEIEVRLGATWIAPAYMEDFMADVLKTPEGLLEEKKIGVQYSNHTGIWNVFGKSMDQSVVATMTHGTKRASAYRLLEDALNLRNVQIFDTVLKDGEEKRVLNKKETILASQKQDLIKEAFKDWIWKDRERRETLCETYNQMFNSHVAREYHGDHLTFPGMNPEYQMRDSQKHAIARILYSQGNSLIAHAVGGGKTFILAAAQMERKRLGLSTKAMFVVPNHLTEQWASDFLRLYPAANVLAARKSDFTPANRKKFCSRIATGQYDAVIIGHTQFQKIPLSEERQERFIKEQLDGILVELEQTKEADGERFTVKQMERQKKSLETQLARLNDNGKKDDVITFEQLGVDCLYVDEAHSYKNLMLQTKMRNVASINTAAAQKSSDLFAKCRYLDEVTGGRGVVFATGTPISNSMTELYTMQRYLQYPLLKELNLLQFDAWASTFGETVTAMELAPEGSGYRMKTRFAKFYNLPELMTLFKECADIQTADMLKLPVPQTEYQDVVLKPSDIQREMVAELGDRAEAVRSQLVEPWEDNMLKITTDGRKLALDQRLINADLPDETISKANACVGQIYSIWQDYADSKATQLVFCDLSTPAKQAAGAEDAGKAGQGQLFTSVYEDMRQKLIGRGIPSQEIRFIHEATTDLQKKELFAQVRNGDVRILFGSTAKMGAGTNVQDRLIALHHLDVPWKPSDVGRILRTFKIKKNVEVTDNGKIII
ncbi:DEAD/DEAH box helicase family protein [Hominibacterium faecale]